MRRLDYEAVPYTISTASKSGAGYHAELNAHIDSIVRHPDLAPRWTELGITSLGGPPDVVLKRNVLETQKWSRVIRDTCRLARAQRVPAAAG